MRYLLRSIAFSVALVTLVAPLGVSAQLSHDSREMMATFINMHGYLCARVERVTPLRQPSVYEVECVQYRGGQTRVSYVVDLKRNLVERQ